MAPPCRWLYRCGCWQRCDRKDVATRAEEYSVTIFSCRCRSVLDIEEEEFAWYSLFHVSSWVMSVRGLARVVHIKLPKAVTRRACNSRIQILYSGKFSWGPNFVLCYLQLIRVFNFRSVHFTQENTPDITYISVLNFRSDRLRMKRTKSGPHEYFPLYGIKS